jgi:hypothetical protein
MQLINTAIYSQQAESRVKAIAKTQEEKIRRRETLEKLKFNRFLQNSQGPTANQELVVGGERYRVAVGGSKLVRLTGEDGNKSTNYWRPTFHDNSNLVDAIVVRPTGNSDVMSTPKRPVIGGVQFQRSRNGNLWRAGLVRASRSVSAIFSPSLRNINHPASANLSGKLCFLFSLQITDNRKCHVPNRRNRANIFQILVSTAFLDPSDFGLIVPSDG